MSWLSASLPGESLLAENKKGVEVENKFLVEGGVQRNTVISVIYIILSCSFKVLATAERMF